MLGNMLPGKVCVEIVGKGKTVVVKEDTSKLSAVSSSGVHASLKSIQMPCHMLGAALKLKVKRKIKAHTIG